MFGLITPWNFPIAIPAWKAAPGAGVRQYRGAQARQLRPRRWRRRWRRSCIEAGAPPGVFNLVLGEGDVGRAIVDHHGHRRRSASPARKASARASPKARPSARRACSWRWAARTRWSCSTTPISTARSRCAVDGAFFATGQRCTASSADHRHGRHPRQLRRRAGRAARGASRSATRSTADRRSARPQREQLEQNLSYVGIARDEGGTAADGRRPARARHARLLHGADGDRRHRPRPCASIARKCSGRSRAPCGARLRRSAGVRQPRRVRPFGRDRHEFAQASAHFRRTSAPAW